MHSVYIIFVDTVLTLLHEKLCPGCDSAIHISSWKWNSDGSIVELWMITIKTGHNNDGINMPGDYGCMVLSRLQ